MMRFQFFLILAIFIFGMNVRAENRKFETDTIQTSAGELKITFIGHGTLMFSFGDKIIHVDPVSDFADYHQLPKADLIFVTHEHFDHLNPEVIEILRKPTTQVIMTAKCADQVPAGVIMKNGEVKSFDGIQVEATPAYNLVHKRPDGKPFHPPGVGNGYILTFGKTRVYIAGDTENIPEMKQLKQIDIAFLPMNLPYTMTPAMVADAARAFQPKILYPYHYGDTDVNQLVKLLKDQPKIEVRIRSMK